MSGLCSDCDTAAKARARYDTGATWADTGRAGETVPEYMGFWVRFAARIVDGIILIVPGALLARFGITGPIISVLVTFIYFVAFTAWCGQTPGKMLMGIQVVNSHGVVPTLGQVLLREVPGKIASTLVLFLGYAWAGWDPNKRAWHDHIGGTYVVRKSRERN